MMKNINLSWFSPALLIGFISANTFAQTVPDPAEKIFEVGYTDTAPQIDGDLSDSAWTNAARRDDFLEIVPVEYRAASERTEVYVMHDEDALYVGFYAYDSQPDQIAANVMSSGGGSMQYDDKVILMLDPNNTQRGGYLFQINPNGVQSEALYITGTQLARDWEAIWDGNARIVEDGWTAEMAIPFKSLSFDPNNDTWGINFTRDLQRTVTDLGWYSLNGEASVASAGKVTGITGLSQGMGLDVIPSLSGTSFDDEVNGISNSELQPSVDVFYKMTPQINLAVTINTDFSATEADSNTLNATRFARFFQEKRAFFLNDFDVFNFGLANLNLNGTESGRNALAFYSRRIGLSSNGRPVDIDGGVKLSGQVGDTEFGVFAMRQNEFEIRDDNGNLTEVIDPTTAMVARVSHSIFDESRIGLIFTEGNPTENQDNSLYGMDFHYRDSDFYANKTFDALLAYQESDDPDFDGDQASYTATLSFSGSQGWQGGAQYFVVEENYSPGIGFTQRTNAELFSTELTHTWVFENSDLFREFQMGLDTARWNDLDTGNLDSSELGLDLASLTFLRGDEVSIELTQEKEFVSPGGRNPTGELGFDIPSGTYTQDIYEFGYATPQFWDLRGEVEFSRGDYYTGTRTKIEPSVGWQANQYVSLSAGYRFSKYDLPEGIVYTREFDADLTIAFGPRVSLSTQIEYDNVRREASFNNRLRWEIQDGQDIWLVFNQGLIDEDEDYEFAVTETAAAFKIRYTLRY